MMSDGRGSFEMIACLQSMSETIGSYHRDKLRKNKRFDTC
jgi:hypothetical protein